jgi:hypothetical protein
MFAHPSCLFGLGYLVLPIKSRKFSHLPSGAYLRFLSRQKFVAQRLFPFSLKY